jgi:hypothetical protein
MYCEWRNICWDLAGNVISDTTQGNIIVNTGKDRVFGLTFVPVATSQFLYLAVGASSTPATVTDQHLTYELTGNANRKTLTSNLVGNVGNPISYNDITLNTVTIGSNTYTMQFQGQVQWASGDGNNGNTFNEYGMFDTATNPGSPTGQSGVMLNHLVDLSPINKSASNSAQTVVTFRF